MKNNPTMMTNKIKINRMMINLLNNSKHKSAEK